MSEHDNTDRGAYLALGAMFGIAAGLGAGILLAPKRGEEIREQIRGKAMDIKGKAKEHLDEQKALAREKLSNTLDRSKELADKAADKTKEMVDKTSDRAKEAAERAQVQTNRAI